MRRPPVHSTRETPDSSGKDCREQVTIQEHPQSSPTAAARAGKLEDVGRRKGMLACDPFNHALLIFLGFLQLLLESSKSKSQSGQDQQIEGGRGNETAENYDGEGTFDLLPRRTGTYGKRQ